MLKKLVIITSFYNSNTLCQMLVNNKVIVNDPWLNSGVYIIYCDNCEFVYVDQPGCNFKIIFNEHAKNHKDHNIFF